MSPIQEIDQCIITNNRLALDTRILRNSIKHSVRIKLLCGFYTKDIMNFITYELLYPIIIINYSTKVHIHMYTFFREPVVKYLIVISALTLKLSSSENVTIL